jgi:APA family basic amino acid/polyamine antiporter
MSGGSADAGRSASPSPRRLHRTLGLGQLTASGVGLIVGAGIYVLLADMAATAGSGVWAAFAIAGLLSGVTALSYAELAGMFPRASAEHEYVRHVAPPVVAFTTGWMMLAGLVVAAGAVALGFAAYLQVFLPAVPVRVGAWALIAVVAIVAMTGIERSARLAVAFSAIQLGGLLLVVLVGLPHLGERSLVAGASATGVVGGAALAFFAFVGFDEVITLSEEVRDPRRTVPRALFLALAISTVAYMAVAVTAVSVLGIDRLAASSQPLADVVDEAIGGQGRTLVSAVALLATANTTLLVLTASSRIAFGMATSGSLPRSFAALSARRVPVHALLVCAAVAAAFVGFGRIGLVASVTDLAVYVVFLAVDTVVVVLRFRQPDRLRPFRVPIAIGRVPILPVLAAVTSALLLAALEPRALAIGVGVVVVGLLVHLALRSGRPVVEATTWRPRRRSHVTEDEARSVADALRLDLAAEPWSAEDLRAGMEVELEHGRTDPDTDVTHDDLLRTAKIALAHLNEIPDYYPRLAAMEAEGRAAWRGRTQRPPTAHGVVPPGHR